MKEEEENPISDDNAIRMTPVRKEAGSGLQHIPPEGSLGLLALGAVGITEWRYARDGIPGQGPPRTGSEIPDDSEPEAEEAEESAREDDGPLDPRPRIGVEVRLREDDDPRLQEDDDPSESN